MLWEFRKQIMIIIRYLTGYSVDVLNDELI